MASDPLKSGTTTENPEMYASQEIHSKISDKEKLKIKKMDKEISDNC